MLTHDLSPSATAAAVNAILAQTVAKITIAQLKLIEDALSRMSASDNNQQAQLGTVLTN